MIFDILQTRSKTICEIFQTPKVARTENSTQKWTNFYVIACFPSVTKGKSKGTAIDSISAQE